MSSILYYSNYCPHCKELLTLLSKSKLKEEVHFLSIDKRVKRNGAMYIQLENGQEILLPPNIRSVPALLMLSRGHRVLQGSEISDYLIEKEVQINMKATNFNGEPMAFGMGDFGSVVSDSFSFLDQSSDEMSAKGNGGLRQMHNYVSLEHSDMIETPPDTYTPDKVGQNSMEEYIKQRNNDVPQGHRRM